MATQDPAAAEVDWSRLLSIGLRLVATALELSGSHGKDWVRANEALVLYLKEAFLYRSPADTLQAGLFLLSMGVEGLRSETALPEQEDER